MSCCSHGNEGKLCAACVLEMIADARKAGLREGRKIGLLEAVEHLRTANSIPWAILITELCAKANQT